MEGSWLLMYGDRIGHEYEVGFVHTEQHRDVALAAVVGRGVRARAVKGVGFAGNKGWSIRVPTKAEVARTPDTVNYALLALFKAGDRVRTLVALHRWGRVEQRPAGSYGRVVDVSTGELHVAFDAQPSETATCAPWWFEVVA